MDGHDARRAQNERDIHIQGEVMNDGSLGILRLIGVAIQNVGFAAIVGTLLSSQWLARGRSTWQDHVGRRLALTLRVASVVSLLASVVSFWAHCALMSDS